MKLLTLNTHSLQGEDTEGALDTLCAEIVKRKPDVITLQEVNQSRSASLYQGALPKGYRFCQNRILLRQDHYGIRLLERLRSRGIFFEWSWLPAKIGYGRYDEGVLTMSRFPMAEVRAVRISEDRPYEDWRRRMALLIRARGSEEWFVNLHMSWWRDGEEPFLVQWQRLLAELPRNGRIWLMGDLNNSAHVRGEGYDRIVADGFTDCFCCAEYRDGEETVVGAIDGWEGMSEQRIRIDHIFCSRPPKVLSYQTLFDGRHSPTVSDHFGVWVETE